MPERIINDEIHDQSPGLHPLKHFILWRIHPGTADRISSGWYPVVRLDWLPP